jgi:hypothetical protein
MCKASVWIEVGTLSVNKTAMQEHNHSPPILDMAARSNMFLIIHNMCTVIIRSTSGYCFITNVEMKAYFAEHCSILIIIIHYLYIK